MSQNQVYELRTYELEFFGTEQVLHTYFKDALIPALNRQGIENVGAFEEVGERLPRVIYLLITYDNINTFLSSKDVLAEDDKYLADANEYMTASQDVIPYKNITTNIIRASKGFPQLMRPNDAKFYELRIYDSHNEDALRRKVKMFDDHEFKIFEEVGLPMVFFGYNIAGDQMPCLSYLLGFKDKAAHAQAWSKFGPHPEWQRIIKLEEFANSMNDIRRVFLKPLAYSQL